MNFFAKVLFIKKRNQKADFGWHFELKISLPYLYFLRYSKVNNVVDKKIAVSKSPFSFLLPYCSVFIGRNAHCNRPLAISSKSAFSELLQL
jgi:hypothetical protein